MQTIPKPVRAAALRKTSRAAAIDRFGGPEVLSLHTLPVPDLDANEVSIRLDTAGVGVWDADMRAGWETRRWSDTTFARSDAINVSAGLRASVNSTYGPMHSSPAR